MAYNGRVTLPVEIVDAILDHVLLAMYTSVDRLGKSVAASDAWRALNPCSRGPYDRDLWFVDGFRALRAPLATCKSWRSRCLERLMQRVRISDSDWSSRQCDLLRLDRLFNITRGLSGDLDPFAHIRHLAFGIHEHADLRPWDYEEFTDIWEAYMPISEVWDPDSEEYLPIVLAIKLLERMPSTLSSLTWCSPTPITGAVAVQLAHLPLEDVLVSSGGYFWGECMAKRKNGTGQC